MLDLVTTELVPSNNPLILICNVEVIPHISIKVRRWLKGCIPAVLGHQNESEQIVPAVRSRLHRTAFHKLWSVDHLWSWRSALVVLKKILEKN